jgi:hypothetical protein
LRPWGGQGLSSASEEEEVRGKGLYDVGEVVVSGKRSAKPTMKAIESGIQSHMQFDIHGPVRRPEGEPKDRRGGWRGVRAKKKEEVKVEEVGGVGRRRRRRSRSGVGLLGRWGVGPVLTRACRRAGSAMTVGTMTTMTDNDGDNDDNDDNDGDNNDNNDNNDKDNTKMDVVVARTTSRRKKFKDGVFDEDGNLSATVRSSSIHPRSTLNKQKRMRGEFEHTSVVDGMVKHPDTGAWVRVDSIPPATFCLQCKAKTTPVWRPGPYGYKTLCNSCGVRYMKWKRKKAWGGGGGGGGGGEELEPGVEAGCGGGACARAESWLWMGCL